MKVSDGDPLGYHMNPVDIKVLSTGSKVNTFAMKPSTHSLSDPLSFAAHHLPASAKKVGTVCVLIDLGLPRSTSLNVIGEGPVDPWEDECRTLLLPFVLSAAQSRAEGHCPEIGLIHLRLGENAVTDLDLRWARALECCAEQEGFTSLGVIALLPSGLQIRVSPY